MKILCGGVRIGEIVTEGWGLGVRGWGVGDGEWGLVSLNFELWILD